MNILQSTIQIVRDASALMSHHFDIEQKGTVENPFEGCTEMMW